MGVYKFYSCPNCGTSLEILVPEYTKGIGEPFTVCQNCKTNVIMKDLFNEWELLTPSQQRGMRLRAVYTALMLGGLGVALLIGVLLNIIPEYLPQDDDGLLNLVIISSITGIVTVFLYKNHGLNKAIEESKKRMRDPLYINKLKILGLANANIDQKYL